MAGVAGKSAGVIGSHDLGEILWLGRVRFVAPCAHHCCVQLRGRNRCGIVGMLCQSSVASLARHHDVLALFLQICNVSVANLAGFVASESHGPSGDLRNGRAAVMSVLSKAAGDDGGAQDNERHQRNDHYGGETDEVFRILEHVRIPASDFGRVLRSKMRNVLGYCVFLLRTMTEVTRGCDGGHQRHLRAPGAETSHMIFA